MIGPILFFLASVAGTVAALSVPGVSGFLPLAELLLLASILLLAFVLLRRSRATPKAPENLIIIDGSNAMHWKDGEPRLETLQEIVGRLTALGYSPGVVFDANAGYLLTGKYQHHADMGWLLGVPEKRILVVPKGTPADPMILAAARDLGARILTNDRYRDWADQHPELREPGYLVRGGYRRGKLWLDLDKSAE